MDHDEIRQKYSKATDGTAVIADDVWLEPFAGQLRARHQRFLARKTEIEQSEGKTLAEFALAHERMGFSRDEAAKGIWFREWAPGAHELCLIGEFNGWRYWLPEHTAKKLDYGQFELFLPDLPNGKEAIPHNSKLKIAMKVGQHWETITRVPAWCKYLRQEPGNPIFDAVYWHPGSTYVWKHPVPPKPDRLHIYEAHVGMATTEPAIGTYKQFKDQVLPWIHELGYNVVQLMAVMEHSYYASFGYQVTNFFAPSSRYGTPEELKELIDEAHRLGILVFLDVVHSHASKNVSDGLNQFDGTDHGYFHGGSRGTHELWDSRLFNYSHWEVQRFLLSNLRYWTEEFRFSGFRFDGVTSMIYKHHGIGKTPMTYSEYFGGEVDEEAVVYLQLANYLLRQVNPNVITISEDVSGFATMCRPIEEGGVGFDYRLGMGIPDKWIELLKKFKDEDWNVGNVAYTLSNRRWKEATIGYAESHDQALVGDKTIAFWLMDKEMYTNMSILSPQSPLVERGLALHKMIRLVTFGLGGESYLNFMGNEFGHPEWIDFPRPGNNWSYHHARRRFDLAKDPLLRYQHLARFDKFMNHLDWLIPFMNSPQYVSRSHEGDKVVVFERGPLLFAFNFHPSQSFSDYKIGINAPGEYVIVLDTDWKDFDGHERNLRTTHFFTSPEPWDDRSASLQVYLPSRTGIVLAPVAIAGPMLDYARANGMGH